MSDFPFPFTPYKVQEDFMRCLYDTLENRRIGIFESPTGTGKSLSIICSAIKWLKDYQKKQEAELMEEAADDGELDWVNEQFKEQKLRQIQSEKQETAEKTVRRQKRVLKSRKRFKSDKENTNDADDADDTLDTYSSSCSSDSDTPPDYCTKIFYCSRTHSQLAQFVNEIRKSPYKVKISVLGSRANLCINPAVKSIKSNAVMNERCLELRQGKSAKKSGEAKGEEKSKPKSKCQYYSATKVRNFATHILSDIQDIESLVKDAEEASSCPYYATRVAVPAAEVVLLPYNMILHKEQRKSLNIQLKDSVVIIDEAHNLIDTINEIHSITVHQKDCQTTHRKLNLYLRRVKVRLLPTNLLRCKQVIHCVGLLSAVFKLIHKQEAPKTYLFTIGDFQTRADLADINLFDLVKYIRESHLAQKIQGYGNENTGDVQNHARSVLAEVSSLFTCLTNADSAGRILVVCGPDACYVRYISLNCENPFIPLLSECRSVVLAGGTMEPIGEIRQQLLSSSLRDVTVFSCGHVIPPENLLPLTVSHGRSMELNFSFEGRKKPGMLQEVGNVLFDVCKVVPGGIVCFFPSYQCLGDTKAVLQKSGSLDKIAKVKTLFYDEAGCKNADNILESYANRIESSTGKNNSSNITGAVLFSVLGGRMSEGINFSDNLGRCVIVVGLPFANPSDPVLQEKMKYLDSTIKSSEEGRTPGQTYYENICMKSVNQAVGRAIRHANDYATILLLDKRYSTERISRKLPAWIRKQLQHQSNLDQTTRAIQHFFTYRRPSG